MSRAAVLAACFSLAACGQPEKPTVSLEEAKKITAQFQPQGLTPPPRTIADITAILDQEKPDPAKIAAIKAAAEAEPSPSLNGADLAKFYFERGEVALDSGRHKQAVADFKKSLEILEPNKNRYAPQYMEALNYLAGSRLALGEIREGIELRVEGTRVAEQIYYWGRVVFNDGNLATTYASIGDFDNARAWLSKMKPTIAHIQSQNIRLPISTATLEWWVNSAQANVFLYQGHYAEAEGYFRRTIAGGEALVENLTSNGVTEADSRTIVDGEHRDLALTLVGEGRVVEAEVEARQALLDQLQMKGRYQTGVGKMTSVLGVVIAAQGRYPEAEKLQRTAIDIYETVGHAPDSNWLMDARKRLAGVLVAEGRDKEALEQFDRMKEALAADPDLTRRYVTDNVDYATALLRAGRAQDALPIARTAQEDLTKDLGVRHRDAAEARGIYATALGATGDANGALAQYRDSVPILIAASRQAEGEASTDASQKARLTMILEGYLGVLADAGKSGSGNAAADAFVVADAARGQAVQQALAASAVRSRLSDPGLSDLVRREQDAGKQISALNELYANALTLPANQQDATVNEALSAQLDQLRTARMAIHDEIEKRFPDYANLIDPKPATVAEAQAALQPGEALIATYVAEDRTYVWAVPKQGAVSFAAVAPKRSELEAIVAQLRRSLDPNASTLGEIPPFDVALAYKLYAALLKPVEPGWKGAKSLLVVPHGALGQLPLALLVTAPASLEAEREGQALFSSYRMVPWLVRDVAVTQLPSVASLTTLRSVPPGGARKPFVGFGDPWFSQTQAAEAQAGSAPTQVAELPADAASTLVATRSLPLHRRSVPKTETVDSAQLALLPRLPDTAEEVRQVALALHADPQADVFLGAQANERQVETMKLDDRRVVMFATHGLVPGDLNGLDEPALALSAPQVAGVQGDGLLTTSKILGLKLDADWVVLSACNTAAGNGAGAEAVSGLGLAFFYAGTRAVLVSNWPVETTSARALTTALFRREAEGRGLTRAEALRGAELALIDGEGFTDPAQNRAVFSYAHPIFWAPFSLVGDGGQG